MTEMIGRRFNGLQIVERLAESDGDGPYDSQAYLAVRTAGKDAVVVKVFPGSFSAPDALASLKQGLIAASHINDGRIPSLLGSGAIDGRPYILLPYSAGASLSARLRSGTAHLLRPIQLLTDLAEALQLAHRQGVHHGTIDPSQLLFDEETGDLRLIGVGQSAVRSARPEDECSVYWAPEVAGGVPGSAASDQYSFGVLALELLSGLEPDRALALLHTSRPLNQKGSGATLGLDPRVISVLAKATSADPERRFGSIEEANRALRIALGDLQPVMDDPPTPRLQEPAPKRSRRRLALATLILLVLGVAGLVPAFAAGLIAVPEWTTFDGEPPSATPDQAAGLSPQITSDDQAGIVLPTAWSTSTSDPVTVVEPSSTSESPASSGAAPTAFTTATTDAPVPAPTNAPTTAPPSPVPPTATSVPPTSVPPTLNPNKCKPDPGHPNYCTPTP